MTLPQVRELTEYWSVHPPVHLLVAGYLGYKPKPHPAAERDSTLCGLLAMAPGGLMTLG